ncbi:hypothetical protein ACQ4M4_11370 [Leptolyngbya sp. AN02str]|uniref:hypothetical protein n=1 Tax=Leptolyngbya sp. AN02str TaxID=3423363 RepID=UPI003D3186E9
MRSFTQADHETIALIVDELIRLGVHLDSQPPSQLVTSIPDTEGTLHISIFNAVEGTPDELYEAAELLKRLCNLESTTLEAIWNEIASYKIQKAVPV